MRLSRLQPNSDQLPQKSTDISAASTELTSLYRYGYEVASVDRSAKSLLQTSSSAPGLDARDSMSFTDRRFLDEETVLTQKQPGTLKVVSGSQFRLTNHKMFAACEQCSLLDKANKKSKETIRSLKLQVMRMEESYRDLKCSRISENQPEAKLAQDNDTKTGGESNLRRKCDYLEDELAKAKKMLSYERNINDGLRSSLEEDRGAHRAQIDALQHENERLKTQVLHFETTSAFHERTSEELQAKLLSYKQQLEHSERRLADCLEKLSLVDEQALRSSEAKTSLEIDRLRRELEKLDAANKALQFTLAQKNSIISQQEDQLATLSSNITDLQKDLTDLRAEHGVLLDKNKTSQEQLTAARKRCDVLESTVKTTIQERDSAKAILPERDAEISLKVRKIESLERDLTDLQSKLNDVTRRMSNEMDNSKRALEKAITSSVRLCVVAPTVNVHVNENRHKFKSKISEKSLKQFLDGEIFEKYCFLFKQSTENAGPTGGSLEAWLQRMLAQMQTSIEAHVNSAMDGSSL